MDAPVSYHSRSDKTSGAPGWGSAWNQPLMCTIWQNIFARSSATLFRSMLFSDKYTRSSTRPPWMYSMTRMRFFASFTCAVGQRGR